MRDKEEIARAETLDTGKTLKESRIDVDDVTAVFRYYADLADKDAGRIVDAGMAHVRLAGWCTSRSASAC